jgi:hypothetical protein
VEEFKLLDDQRIADAKIYFNIKAPSTELQLFKLIREYLGQGKIKEEDNEFINFIVKNPLILTNKLIPLFRKNSFFLNNSLHSAFLVNCTQICTQINVFKEENVYINFKSGGISLRGITHARGLDVLRNKDFFMSID